MFHKLLIKILDFAYGVSRIHLIRTFMLVAILHQNEFERKKQEILAAQSASAVDGETNSASQPAQLSEMNIWVQSVGGKKNERVKDLRSLGRSVKATNSSTSTLPIEIDEMIKSRVDASNVDLYAQLQHERKKNKRMRKELHFLNYVFS